MQQGPGGAGVAQALAHHLRIALQGATNTKPAGSDTAGGSSIQLSSILAAALQNRLKGFDRVSEAQDAAVLCAVGTASIAMHKQKQVWHAHAAILCKAGAEVPATGTQPEAAGQNSAGQQQLEEGQASDHSRGPRPDSVVWLYSLYDLEPVSMRYRPAISKGLSKAPWAQYGLLFRGFNSSAETPGEGIWSYNHAANGPGASAASVLLALAIHVFPEPKPSSAEGEAGDTSPEPIRKQAAELAARTEYLMVRNALAAALSDLKQQSSGTFGQSKLQFKLSTAIPMVERSLLTIIGSAANAVLLPFACNAFGCDAPALSATLHSKLGYAAQEALKPKPAEAKGRKRPAEQAAQTDHITVGGDDDTDAADVEGEGEDEAGQEEGLGIGDNAVWPVGHITSIDPGHSAASAQTSRVHTQHRASRAPGASVQAARATSASAQQQDPAPARLHPAGDLQARAQQLYGVRPLKSVNVQEDQDDSGDEEWLF